MTADTNPQPLLPFPDTICVEGPHPISGKSDLMYLTKDQVNICRRALTRPTAKPERLLSCPFCGGIDLRVAANLVACNNRDCDASGPEISVGNLPSSIRRNETGAPGSAVALWNTRPTPSQQEIEAAILKMFDPKLFRHEHIECFRVGVAWRDSYERK